MEGSLLHDELGELVQKLSLMVKVEKDYIVALTHIVIPTLPPEKTLELIQMLLLLPSFLASLSPQDLMNLVSHPPVEGVHALPFRLLLDLREIQRILKGLTRVQLLILLDNILPHSTPQQQLELITNLQEVFMTLSVRSLTEFGDHIRQTPAHHQRAAVLRLAPRI